MIYTESAAERRCVALANDPTLGSMERAAVERLLAEHRSRGDDLRHIVGQRDEARRKLAVKDGLLREATESMREGVEELRARGQRIDILVERLLAAQTTQAGREAVLAEHASWCALRPVPVS